MAKYDIIEAPKEPLIFTNIKAMQKMRYYINNCDTEVGWLGYVSKTDEDTYLIEDVFLVAQEVNAATTEIDKVALADLAVELLSTKEGIDQYNKLRLWGHSHVDMDTSPSGQDDEQMDAFSTTDYFIRLIGNKKGEWHVSLYDYDSNIAWTNLPIMYHHELEIDTNELDKELAELVKEKKWTREDTTAYDYRSSGYWEKNYAVEIIKSDMDMYYEKDDLYKMIRTKLKDLVTTLEFEYTQEITTAEAREIQQYARELLRKGGKTNGK